MEGPSGKVWTIIKDRLETSFRCMMMNPVSNETSAHFKNPFIIHVEPGLVYGAKGDDMILGPPPMNDTIQSIVWKHKANIAADWYEAGNEFMCHGQFIGRCEVNTDTGALTIKGMMLKDIGIYTPEINCKDYNKIQLSVISRVTKPSVGKSCNTKNTLCRLTCEGNTADAEPITYKWLYDNKEDGPSVQKILLTEYLKEDHFRCIMMNPVSNGTSESITNPLIKQEQDWLISILVPVVVVVVLVVVILFAVFIYKHIREKRRRPNNRRDDKKENGTKYELKPLNNSKGAKGTCDKTQHLSNGADASGVRRTSLVSDPPVIQNGHSGAETETVTPETSNQSPAEAAVSDTDQETDLPSVEVPDPLNSGCLHTNKDSEKSALMPDKKPETNCEPSADEQRADD
ncbi:uncharacterized protein LOC121506664 [Cheilinus undulatus]|uniref:uncharacterized protein LOC121506664 n=1 Tax=Cheilinus undulatus TaxID=241271 RepID=UPI001BD21560|nr:uncharacterized protein LOC121506664 [Cheilinus undulatus]